MEVLMEYQHTLEAVQTLVKRTNKRSVLIFLQHSDASETAIRIPAIRESVSNVIAFVSLGDCQYIHDIINLSKGIIDKIVIDADCKRPNSVEIVSTIKQEAMRVGISFALYSDYASWAVSAVQYMLANEGYDGKVMLVGHNALATRVIMEMIARQIHVYLLASEYTSVKIPYDKETSIQLDSPYIHIISNINQEDGFTTLLGCSLMEPNANIAKFGHIPFKYIYDVGIHNFTKEFVCQQRLLGANIYRSDDRAGIAGTIINIMETDFMLQNMVGVASLPTMRLVGGGYLGEEGDIVVDNARNPKCILGVAAGDGTFKTNLSNEDKEHIAKLQSLL